MNITVTFETIAEVKAFAEMITGPAGYGTAGCSDDEIRGWI